jgi:hypothetical protein
MSVSAQKYTIEKLLTRLMHPYVELSQQRPRQRNNEREGVIDRYYRKNMFIV